MTKLKYASGNIIVTFTRLRNDPWAYSGPRRISLPGAAGTNADPSTYVGLRSIVFIGVDTRPCEKAPKAGWSELVVVCESLLRRTTKKHASSKPSSSAMQYIYYAKYSFNEKDY